MPRKLLEATPSNHASQRYWLTLLPEYSNWTAALEATVLAICTAKLGRVHEDAALVRESLKFYIQGLWELQRALYNPELMYKAETAASCLALVMYEVMECPDGTVQAWVKHVQGCAKLFELRGPKAYSSDFEHEIFLDFRQMEVREFSYLPFSTLRLILLGKLSVEFQSRSNKPSALNAKLSSLPPNGIPTPGKATPSPPSTTSSTSKPN